VLGFAISCHNDFLVFNFSVKFLELLLFHIAIAGLDASDNEHCENYRSSFDPTRTYAFIEDPDDCGNDRGYYQNFEH